MDMINIIVLRLCVVALVWKYAASCPSENGRFVFGPTCQNGCHCAGGGQCDYLTGECTNGCEGSWFGTGCQYYDTAQKVKNRHLDNLPNPQYSSQANDGDVTTCSYTNYSMAGISRSIPPYWMIFYEQNVTFPEGSDIALILHNTYLGDFNSFKIYIENYPADMIGCNTIECRNYIPNDRQLCYQHDGSIITSTSMIVRCNRTLVGNSLRVELRDKYTQLVLCDIKISQGRNLAFKKTTSSSSVIDNSSAVDGSEQTCTNVSESDPWWQVDLGFKAQIYHIRIQSSDQFRLYNPYIDGKLDGDWFTIQHFKTWGYSYSIITSSVARYVRVKSQYSQYSIGMCEVYVFGDCTSLMWGETCQYSCGHCNTGSTCNPILGTCNDGCASGYKNNPYCSEECDAYRFGQNCSQMCSTNCVNMCNKVDGSCLCRPGWLGSRCTHECNDYRYGQNCTQTCSDHCSSVCNKLDGTCSCKPGWQGSHCTEACADGTYGLGCRENCGYCQGSLCDKFDGRCPFGCQPGWQGSKCITACDDTKHGQQCRETCSLNCANVCNKVNGTCSCKAGWQGSLCTEECTAGKFGSGCQNDCGKCKGSACNKIDGHCPEGCEPGWMGSNCTQECHDTHYGQNCNNLCSVNCAIVCNKVDGTCSCRAGWNGSLCTESCTGLYGVNCTRLCSENCLNKETCNNSNGECPSGCVDGYDFAKDKTCSLPYTFPAISDKDSKGIPISAFVAVVVFLVIAVGSNIVLATFYIKQRRKRQSGTENNTIVTSPSSLRSDEYDTISPRLKETNDYEGLQMETRTYSND